MRPCSGTTSVLLHFAAVELPDSISTQLTQSSCSKLDSYNGGIKLLVYWRVKVVSDDNPFAVRYSSIVVRRNAPLMRKSKGIGAGVSSIASELRIWDKPYLRTSGESKRISQNEQQTAIAEMRFSFHLLVGTSSCLLLSGSSISGKLVVNITRI